ncbi:MAG: 50S ribosomal protein L29 [Candidatus Cloacimonetes bacterium]|nr:50S ribosomal protein L29 [Candidatus Cloacimonadota bacterium]
MKMSELREMTQEELVSELEEKREALFNLRFQKAKQILTNNHAIRMAKRDIARICTLLRVK